MALHHFPDKQGLYDPWFEHDACGVGFVCHIKGQRSNQIVIDGLEALLRLEHRGAVGSDPRTGDGAGILIQIPDDFLQMVTAKQGLKLPAEGDYGTGLVFLPVNPQERDIVKNELEKIIEQESQFLIGWRDVPVNPDAIGKTARDVMPDIKQVFIRKNSKIMDIMAFERKLYVIRKRLESFVRNSSIEQKGYFYIPSLSSKTFSYRGMLMSRQISEFFTDLQDSNVKSAICMVHSRYSTNTFPSWDLAQPFRYLAHNGEINTLRGNINWTKAREGLLSHEVWGEDIEKLKPITVDGLSDSATIDNVFELLTLSGRSLPHAMMLLVPSAWENNSLMQQKYRDFYKYHICLSEPWDGPASMAFTDGTSIGAVLDRNGLRPSRYIITKDDRVVMASEVGVLDIEPENIAFSGRLEPGKIFYINTEYGKIVSDTEVKDSMAEHAPYGDWVKQNQVDLNDLNSVDVYDESKEENVINLMKTFGYDREDLKVLLKPMAKTGKEPTASMGNDNPHACMSDKPQLLYTYFKQLFAQVTNPAIDPIREAVVMSLQVFIGPEKNILEETPEHACRLRVRHPVMSNEDLAKIKTINKNGFKTKTISILFEAKDGFDGFMKTIDRICDESVKAINDGYSFVILSDRGVNKDKMALPALLAVGALHQHLIRKALRTQIGLVLESGEPKEIHHFNVLFGFGVDAVNPYLAYRTLDHLVETGEIKLDKNEARKNYIKAVEKGILKILSKMGISTLQSYKGAQIFEALGIHEEVIDRCFTRTTSRIGGVTFEHNYQEIVCRHENTYYDRKLDERILDPGGRYQWKRDGEFHLWNPESITALQLAVQRNEQSEYNKFATLINDQSGHPTTLRGMFRFKKQKSIPIEEVEPVEKIFPRFVTGAMSFGSISKAAHETLAIAMNRIGGMSNTGEGGEDPERFVPMPNGDSRRSKIKQVASGRFGVTTNYLVNGDEIQIKIAQGAKPGEGGQLPGHKVSAIIARTRYTTPGVTLISPPPHHDIYSIEDLAQLIFDLKNTNPDARISVKLVSEVGVGTIAAGVAKGHADMILISGGDGGTGASPASSLRHAGLPWELGLSETHQTLVLNDLRSRVRLQTDGQMRTGRDVAIAALLGAEEYGFCTAALIATGCVMLRHCHLNNCSMGIATQDDILQGRYRGNPQMIVNYMTFIAQELRQIMADLGFRTMNEMIGRSDILEENKELHNWKTGKMDFSRIFFRPDVPETILRHKVIDQDHAIDKVMDRELIEKCKPAIENRENVKLEIGIKNTNRTVGAMLSGAICKQYGESMLPEDTVHVKFTGEAGQSFAAWLAQGVTFELEGLSNDYIGKGMFGGKVVVYPYLNADYIPEENILIGNTTFYGAIRGQAYIRGKAGERFCIRNSGVNAVVEGVGDHGCEYMTGGRVVILGSTGRNFAAGMSGGVAYIWDKDGSFKDKVNMDMVELEELTEEDLITMQNLIHNHVHYTGSAVGKYVSDNWHDEVKKFVKVMPIEYKRILETQNIDQKLGLSEVSDG